MVMPGPANRGQIRHTSVPASPDTPEQYILEGLYPVRMHLRGQPGEWQAVHDWCREHVSEDGYRWTGSWFWFRDRADAVLFALRWS